jgi:hypothetical protein
VFRHLEADSLAVDHPMRGISQFEQHLVRARFQADHDHRFAAGVDKMPWRVVNGDVEVADPRRDVEGAFAEHRYHAQILGPVLDEDEALGQLFGEWWIDNQPGRWLIFDRDQR